jgi:hypothetical protein
MHIKVLAVMNPTSTDGLRQEGARISILVVEEGFLAFCRHVAEMPGATVHDLPLPEARTAELIAAARSLASPVACRREGVADRGVLLCCEAGTPLDSVVDAVFELQRVRHRRATVADA